jgi:membrane protease YdiL (CAAX protease family)
MWFLYPINPENMNRHSSPSFSALLEIGIMFLPAIPAYLWIWPNLKGSQNDIFQVIVYLYVLAGTLFIGLRRWNWSQLGINRQGIGLTLACGLVILAGRLMIILSIDWAVHPMTFTWLRLAGNLIYYFGLVGLVEELLFRGLIYRLLEDWRGVRWAIWGSSFGFGLWHVFGQGPLVGIVTLVIGLLYAQLRWRGGGIVGLIVLHGLWDLETVWLVTDTNSAIFNHGVVAFRYPVLVNLGTLLLLLVPAYLAWVHPRIERIIRRNPSE